jgi:cytochrome bd-type quinol oxidase subunit 2
MIRILLTIVLPLLLPTLLYVLWLTASRRAALATPAPWRDLPWVWLAAAGVVLAALLLFFINIRVGSQGAYVPPKYIDGRVVPGHVVPTEPSK